MNEAQSALEYVTEVLEAVAKKYKTTAPMPTDMYMEDDFNRLTLVVEDQVLDASRGYIRMQDVYLVDKKHFVAVGYYVGHESFGPKDWVAYNVQAIETHRFVSV